MMTPQLLWSGVLTSVSNTASIGNDTDQMFVKDIILSVPPDSDFLSDQGIYGSFTIIRELASTETFNLYTDTVYGTEPRIIHLNMMFNATDRLEIQFTPQTTPFNSTMHVHVTGMS